MITALDSGISGAGGSGQSCGFLVPQKGFPRPSGAITAHTPMATRQGATPAHISRWPPTGWGPLSKEANHSGPWFSPLESGHVPGAPTGGGGASE